MGIIILGLALIVLILAIVIVALQKKDIIEIVIEAKFPFSIRIVIKRDKHILKKNN